MKTLLALVLTLSLAFAIGQIVTPPEPPAVFIVPDPAAPNLPTDYESDIVCLSNYTTGTFNFSRTETGDHFTLDP